MAKEIQITGPVTTVLAELDRSAAEDVANARRRSRAGWGIAGSILLFIVGMISTAALGAFGAVLLVLGVVALIVCIVRYVTCNRRDFEDRKRNVAREFFAVLAQDVPRKARCSVQLNDDGYLQHGQVSEQTGDQWVEREITPKKRVTWTASVKAASYEDKWGLLTGRLHDGTAFKATITQNVKRKSKSKRKYTKIRECHQEEVTLTLRLDPAAYPGLAQLPAQLQAGTVDGMNVTRAEVANNVLRVAAATGPVLRTHGRYGWSNFDLPGLVTGQKLLDLFVFVYTQLATARGEGVQRP